MNYTYIVQCADGTLYTGWTNCLARRMKAHNEGKAGAKYTLSLIHISGQLSGELKIKKRDSAGYVTELTIGETLLEGESFAAGMGLESANFSLKKKDDIYYLRVRGSGHGVGFSQFGGNEMAKNGSSAEEILEKYFPEMELKAED